MPKIISKNQQFIESLARETRPIIEEMQTEEMKNKTIQADTKQYSADQHTLSHEEKKHMKELYAKMKDPNHPAILLNYPNGPRQFFDDIESGVYDD